MAQFRLADRLSFLCATSSRGHVLAKEGDWNHPNPGFWNRTLTRRACSRSLDSMGRYCLLFLQAALTSHVYSHRQPTCLRYGDPCQGIWGNQNGLIKAGLVIAKKKGSIALSCGPLLLRKLNCCSINQQSWMRLLEDYSDDARQTRV